MTFTSESRGGGTFTFSEMHSHIHTLAGLFFEWARLQWCKRFIGATVGRQWTSIGELRTHSRVVFGLERDKGQATCSDSIRTE